MGDLSILAVVVVSALVIFGPLILWVRRVGKIEDKAAQNRYALASIFVVVAVLAALWVLARTILLATTP